MSGHQTFSVGSTSCSFVGRDIVSFSFDESLVIETVGDHNVHPNSFRLILLSIIPPQIDVLSSAILDGNAET